MEQGMSMADSDSRSTCVRPGKATSHIKEPKGLCRQVAVTIAKPSAENAVSGKRRRATYLLTTVRSSSSLKRRNPRLKSAHISRIGHYHEDKSTDVRRDMIQRGGRDTNDTSFPKIEDKIR